MAKIIDVLTGFLKKESVSDPLIQLIAAHTMNETYPHGFLTQWKEIDGTVTTHPGPKSTVLAYLLAIPHNKVNHIINTTAKEQEIPTQSIPNPWVKITPRKRRTSALTLSSLPTPLTKPPESAVPLIPLQHAVRSFIPLPIPAL